MDSINHKSQIYSGVSLSLRDSVLLKRTRNLLIVSETLGFRSCQNYPLLDWRIGLRWYRDFVRLLLQYRFVCFFQLKKIRPILSNYPVKSRYCFIMLSWIIWGLGFHLRLLWILRSIYPRGSLWAKNSTTPVLVSIFTIFSRSFAISLAFSMNLASI